MKVPRSNGQIAALRKLQDYHRISFTMYILHQHDCSLPSASLLHFDCDLLFYTVTVLFYTFPALIVNMLFLILHLVMCNYQWKIDEKQIPLILLHFRITLLEILLIRVKKLFLVIYTVKYIYMWIYIYTQIYDIAIYEHINIELMSEQANHRWRMEDLLKLRFWVREPEIHPFILTRPYLALLSSILPPENELGWTPNVTIFEWQF